MSEAYLGNFEGLKPSSIKTEQTDDGILEIPCAFLLDRTSGNVSEIEDGSVSFKMKDFDTWSCDHRSFSSFFNARERFAWDFRKKFITLWKILIEEEKRKEDYSYFVFRKDLLKTKEYDATRNNLKQSLIKSRAFVFNKKYHRKAKAVVSFLRWTEMIGSPNFDERFLVYDSETGKRIKVKMSLTESLTPDFYEN